MLFIKLHFTQEHQGLGRTKKKLLRDKEEDVLFKAMLNLRGQVFLKMDPKQAMANIINQILSLDMISQILNLLFEKENMQILH